MITDVSRIGRRGTVVIPAALRRKFGLKDGSLVMTEEKEEGILLRPAAVIPLEAYTLERKAQFLLSNAVDAEDYRAAVKDVKKLGLDPDTIKHRKPAGVR
jgi:AbrB family looped-hinge helix DNA binding protein